MKVTNPTITTLTVNWNPADGNVQGYKVIYVPEDGGEETVVSSSMFSRGRRSGSAPSVAGTCQAGLDAPELLTPAHPLILVLMWLETTVGPGKPPPGYRPVAAGRKLHLPLMKKDFYRNLIHVFKCYLETRHKHRVVPAGTAEAGTS